MFKKILLVLSLFFVFSCEDNEADVEFPMKLWLNGVEVDVEAEYQRITTFAEANMEGRIEFTNLKVEKDTANTPYSDYGGH
jgi:hypothetical protein|tara:strand:- start:474 stop:716 length:243 start_codon:yes stop_codon:yes gene_type:complete